MDGILLVDKPSGYTSHDVVAKVRRILTTELRSKNNELSNSHNSKFITHNSISPKVKVGHTGTLDPMATGLMILVLGKYTKRAAEFSKLDKTYEAELNLGAISTTGDMEGEIITENGQKPTIMALRTVLRQFEGQISQTPPLHSAIKIDGQRAYKLARKGLTPVMKPREVTIYSIKLTDYSYPIVKITTSVSSGTYIRSLAKDIGETLGTGAYLSGLRRTKVGIFKIEESVSLEGLDFGKLQRVLLNDL